MNVPLLVGQVVLVVLFAPLLQGVIKSVKAACQNRRGPGLLQPSYDVLKLLRRESVVSEHASWIFAVTPYVLFLTALSAGLIVPMVTAQAPDSTMRRATRLSASTEGRTTSKRSSSTPAAATPGP